VSLFALSNLVWAQSSTTSLRGTVTDASGAAVSRAKVSLSNPERAIEKRPQPAMTEDMSSFN
jgi:hypothetical protein